MCCSGLTKYEINLAPVQPNHMLLLQWLKGAVPPAGLCSTEQIRTPVFCPGMWNRALSRSLSTHSSIIYKLSALQCGIPERLDLHFDLL